jgi:hypothetical protein
VHRKTSFACRKLCLEQDRANRFERGGVDVDPTSHTIWNDAFLDAERGSTGVAALERGIFEEENVRRSVHFDLERRNCFDASSPLIEGACALNMPDKPPASPPASFSAVAAAEVLPTSAPGDYHAPVVSITPA